MASIRGKPPTGPVTPGKRNLRRAVRVPHVEWPDIGHALSAMSPRSQRQVKPMFRPMTGIVRPALGRAALTLTAALLLAAVSCTQVDEARRSMRRGEPVRAVQLYEQALTDEPEDPHVRRELAEAKTAAGNQLAEQAREALDDGRLADAVTLATEAAQHDRAHRPLEQQARRARAFELLASAEAALNGNQFDSARRSADAALEVAHDLAEPVTMLARVDRVEAEDLRVRLDELLHAGRFADAARLAARAAELQPGDQQFAALPTIVDRRRREAAFDALAVEAEAAIASGRLGEFWPMHAQLASLNVRTDALNRLQQRYAEREQQLLDAIDAAEAARRQDNFVRAIGLYRTAESIATDRPDLAEQRTAVETLREAHELRQSGIAAMGDGDYDAAIDALRQSLQLDAVEETEELLRESQRRYHRQSYRDALGHGNLASAVDHLTKLLRVEPDDKGAATLEQLRRELAEASLAEASALHADGDTQTALHVLRRAMDRVHEPQLDALHARLKAERMLQQAVAAERAQQFDRSRDLYLEALAAGGDRAAIEARISDIGVLDEMQQQQRAAEQNARELGSALNSTRLQLRSRESEIRDLHTQIRRCEAEIDRLAYGLRQAEYDLRHEKSRNQALESRVYALKCEIDRLESDLRRAKLDAHRARSSYAGRSSRDDHDPRRPR